MGEALAICKLCRFVVQHPQDKMLFLAVVSHEASTAAGRVLFSRMLLLSCVICCVQFCEEPPLAVFELLDRVYQASHGPHSLCTREPNQARGTLQIPGGGQRRCAATKLLDSVA